MSYIQYISFTILISFSVATNGLICDTCSDTAAENSIISKTDGYEAWNGHYYKIFDNVQNWETARKLCEDEGSYLTIINSKEEASYVRQLIDKVWSSTSSYPGAWAGFHDSDGNANWRTIHDSSLEDAGYNTWWKPCQRRRKNQCGTVKICGRFAAMPCDNNLVFVCEMEVVHVAAS